MNEQELSSVLDSVRRFIRTDVVPLEAAIDRTDEIPDSIRAAAKAMGLFGFALPVEHGGLGLSMVEEARLVIELGYTTPAFRSMFGTNNGIAGHSLMEGGTEAQQSRWLPQLADGTVTASFALSEPEAGSDPRGITTTATRTADGWVLNGSKRFITNAPLADLFIVYAQTRDGSDDRGISAFLVPSSTRGVAVATKDAKMGQHGAWTADVHFDGVAVGDDAVLGGVSGVGQGMQIAKRSLAHGRVHIAAVCVGLAQRLVDESLSYANSRKQSGHPIGEFQLVQGLVADSVTDLYAGRSLVLSVAESFDDRSDMQVGPASAKYFCSEMVCRVADRAVQIHGGAGYMQGVAVERFYRDARLFRIYEGTSQIQQVIIARQSLAQHAARTSSTDAAS